MTTRRPRSEVERAAQSSAVDLAALLDGYDRRLRALETTASLAHSSIEDGAIEAHDDDGSTTMIVGKQFDGTSTAASVLGPAPPTPLGVSVTGVPGGVNVAWGGQYEDDALAPMDWAGVDIAVGTSSGFDAIGTPPTDRFGSARGGTRFLALAPGDYYVALVTRTQSGRPSDPTPAVPVTAIAAVTTDGEPPAYSPVPEIIPGIDVVYVKVTPVPNADPVTYDIHASTAGATFTASPATVAASTLSTLTPVNVMPDGTAVPTDTEVWWRVVARDDDDAAAPSAAVAGHALTIDVGDLPTDLFAAIDAAGAAADAAQAQADTANAAAIAAATAAATAQATADNAIRTYYQSAAPTGLNNTTDLGDLWFDTDTNQAYRWGGTGPGWVLIEDNSIATALANAAAAQATATAAAAAASTAQGTADGKNKVTYSGANPTGTGTTGDLWYKFTGGLVVGQWHYSGGWVADTIDGAVLANLNAASITTGILNVALLIQAGAITTDKFDAGSVTTDVLAAESVTTDNLAANSVVAAKIAAGQVDATHLAALIAFVGNTLQVGDGTGSVITLDEDRGINIVDVNGNIVAYLPANLLDEAQLTANIVARSLTALGAVALRAAINELGPGAGLVFRAGTTPPATPLTLTPTYPAFSLSQMNADGEFTIYNGVGYFLSYLRGQTTFNVYTADLTTGAQATLKTGLDLGPAGSDRAFPDGPPIRFSSSTTAGVPVWAVRVQDQGFGFFPIHFITFYDNNWNYVKWLSWTWPSGSTNYDAVLGFHSLDANKILAMTIRDSDGAVRAYTINTATADGGDVAYTTIWTSTYLFDPSGGSELAGCAAGSFDFGSTRYLLVGKIDAASPNNNGVWVFAAAGVRNQPEGWDMPAGANVQNLAWDDRVVGSGGQRFWSAALGNIYKHSRYTWTDTEHGTLWASEVWENDSTHQTKEGPVTMIPGPKKRAFYKVSGPAIPAGVAQWRLFLGFGSADPGRTGRYSQGVETAKSYQTLDLPVFSGSNPPATATFPGGVSSFARSDDGVTPGWQFNGDGSGHLAQGMAWDISGAWTGWSTWVATAGSTANWPAANVTRARYRQFGPIARVEIATSPDAAKDFSNVDFSNQNILGGLPAAMRPSSVPAPGIGSWADAPITIQLNTDGSVQINGGVEPAGTTGWSAGDLVIASFTYMLG